VSTDKKADWSEYIMAESDPSGSGSQMPNDEFTWTDGSNYGLDGFQYDQTMGEGTRNRGDQSGMAGPITPAQTKGMSTLPDGLVDGGSDSKEAEVEDDLSFVDEDEGIFDLGDMLSPEEGGLHMTASERQAASLANLDWLDPTQEQDPARLPKGLRPDQPPLHSLPELEDAWGVDRRTDGLRLLQNNNRDREVAQYEQSIESGLPATPGVEKNAADSAWHIKKAVRMSHYGQSMGEIANYLYANLKRALADKALGVIASEHGVAGNVFVRASAFPGLRNGKWAKQIRKSCRAARYVITDDPAVAAKLSMQMVSEVPYKKALRQYLPHLKAAGYKVASVGGDPKKTLQLAFLTGPKEAEYVPSTKPVDVRPADRVTLAVAKKAAAAAPRQVQQVIARDDQAKARKAALVVVKKAADAGLITQAEALKLAQSKANPVAIRKAAEAIARAHQMPKTAEYGGVGTHATVHRQSYDQAWAKLAQAELTATQMRKALAHVARMVEAGQLSAKEGRKASAEATPEMVLKVATAYANSSGTRKTKMASVQPSKDYDGPMFRQALQSGPKPKKLAADEEAMRQASASSGIKVAEFRSMARWVRQKMSEGMAGSDLTTLMTIRFAGPLRAAAEGLVAMLREEHEGFSGHLYVDAGAYASETGSNGCEKAASGHRTSQVPFVKAMPRCAGCVLANSNGVCTKYGKELLHQLPKDAATFKQQMIHMADAPDHEITASLFDPGEFNLGNPMENLDVDEPAVTENIGVLFGEGLIL
jgi:hypothetical protein